MHVNHIVLVKLGLNMQTLKFVIISTAYIFVHSSMSRTETWILSKPQKTISYTLQTLIQSAASLSKPWKFLLNISFRLLCFDF